MYKFLKKMCLYVVFLYGCFLLLLILSSAIVKNKMAKRGRGVIIDKNALLAATKSPKIILIGGSNVCYGINSKLLQDSLKMPVVDMAITAEVGMLFYYNQVKPYIHKGDIVVGIPEYAAYKDNKLYGEASMYELSVVQPSNLKYIAPIQWIRFPRFAGDIIKENYNTFVSEKNSIISNGRNLYNALGDYEGHKGKNSTFKVNPTGSLKNERLEMASAFKKMLDNFNIFCNQKGGTYLHSFPVYARSRYKMEWGNEMVKQLNGIAVINSPEEYLFGPDSLYDTENHIQYEYRDLRTKRLINNLKNFLEKQSNISLE